jgi:tetratricopeptide (TPR) repeat protein
MEAEADHPQQLYAVRTQKFEVLNGRRKLLYQQMGDIESARIDAQALLPLAQQLADDPSWLIDARLAQAEVFDWNHRQEIAEALPLAEQALALARQLGDSHREMESLIAVSSARFNLKDPLWQEAAERALALARQLGDLKTEVKLLLGIGGAYGLDDLPRSREYLEAALARSETLNDKATEVTLLNAIGQQHERAGDYHRQLAEFEQKRLQISRDIGNRLVEGNALMFCGQIQGLYLGDYQAGLALEMEALRIWENITGKLFPLLRIAQIQTVQGQCDAALQSLETARPVGEKIASDIGRAGLGLVTAILYNALADEPHLREALQFTSQIAQMVTDSRVSRQYKMAAACEATVAHLGLARALDGAETGAAERQTHLRQALDASQSALNLYQEFGFVQIVECTSEEVLYRHSQALAANGRSSEADDFTQRAHDEMMRKYALIPPDSHFRKTYLENIALHRQLLAAGATGR